jgi:hypothetical protein
MAVGLPAASSSPQARPNSNQSLQGVAADRIVGARKPDLRGTGDYELSSRGLDWDTQRFLGQVAAGTRNGDELPAKGEHLTRHGLQPGTNLVREWDGKPRVMVLDQALQVG